MKIEANDKDVQEILALGYFKIPRFQRPYSWTDEEVDNFWEDVINRADGHYFIGSMVVYQTDKPYFGIVDGQQRLTTITLILAAIRNAFLEYGDVDLAKGVHGFIEKANLENKNEYILNSETSYPYLQGYIQSFQKEEIECKAGSEEQNLKSAFELIEKKLYLKIPRFDGTNFLQEAETQTIIENLKKIRDKVRSLKLVFIQLDNEDDAYLIFETLNTRGKDLTTSDLVKNLLLQNLRSSNITLDSSKETWNLISDKFDDKTLENFLYHYWLSKHSYTTKKELFIEIKKYIDCYSKYESEDKSRLLLSEFQKNSDYYISITSPNNYSWSPEEKEGIQKSLSALRLFTVKQQSSMVLALMRVYREKKITLRALSRILWQIECFHFIFNAIISERSSGSIAKLYSKFAQDLSKTDSQNKIQSINNELIRKLKEQIPSFNEFEVKFMDLTYTKNKKIIQYILEKFIGKNINGLPIDHASASIEHLFSQSKGDNSVVGSIGNLILIDKMTNAAELKNFDFTRKIQILKDKKYPLDNYLLKVSQWTESEINERGRSMARKAYYEIWHL